MKYAMRWRILTSHFAKYNIQAESVSLSLPDINLVYLTAEEIEIFQKTIRLKELILSIFTKHIHADIVFLLQILVFVLTPVETMVMMVQVSKLVLWNMVGQIEI